MQTHKIEHTDLYVSALCLGGNVFGWTCDEPTSFTVPATPRAERVQSLYLNERSFSILAKVEQAAQAYHATIAQIALAWMMARPWILAPITSATSVEQMSELLGAVDIKLTAEDLAVLDKVSVWHL